MSRVEGAWVPNWPVRRHLHGAVAGGHVAVRFSVDMRPLAWPEASLGDAMQTVTPSVGRAWFDSEELRERTAARHGRPGDACSACGTWRWLPLSFEDLPPLRLTDELDEVDVAASREWFGARRKAFRKVLVRRGLTELFAGASPKDFRLREVA